MNLKSDEPIKFIFKPTKRILSNFFEPLRKKRYRPAEVDLISARYYLVEPCSDRQTRKKLKIEYEPNLVRSKPKSWSDSLFSPNISAMSEEDEEEVYMSELESSELDNRDSVNLLYPNNPPWEQVEGVSDKSKKSNDLNTLDNLTACDYESRRSSPVHSSPDHVERIGYPVLSRKPNTLTNYSSIPTYIPPKEIVVIIDSDDDVPVNPSHNSSNSYLDQRLFDSHYSVGNDLAKQLFGADDDDISEYEPLENIPPTKTIVLDDSSDNEPVQRILAPRSDSSDDEGRPEDINDPLLQQLLNQFKPKETAGKKRTAKAGNPSASGSNSRSGSKPFKKRFNRGGGGKWRKKK
jgi:hypothetical protein